MQRIGKNLYWGFRNNSAPSLALGFLLFSLLMQRSDAQEEQRLNRAEGSSLGPSLPGYNFRIAVPETSGTLTLPELPVYDSANIYLQVRDSSKDWYQGDPPGKPVPLLDENLRILPDMQSEDVLLDTRFVPIPRVSAGPRASAGPRFGTFPQNRPGTSP